MCRLVFPEFEYDAPEVELEFAFSRHKLERLAIHSLRDHLYLATIPRSHGIGTRT